MPPRRLDATFAALAEPTRRSVVDLLRRGPQRAGELADALAVSPPVMSRHLGILRRAGLVRSAGIEDDARVRVYELRRERFRDLRRWLDEVEAFWSTQLDAFREHTERHARGRRP